MAIEITRQTLTLTGITGNTVSTIEPDEVNGGFVRRILFYTEPKNQVNRRPDIELILTSDSEDDLKLLTPELQF